MKGLNHFSNDKGGKLRFKCSLKEFSLREYQHLETLKHGVGEQHLKLQELGQNVASGTIDRPTAELDEAEIFINRDKLIREFLNIMVKKPYASVVKSLSPKEAFVIYDSLAEDQEEYHIGIEVYIPGVNNPLIKNLREQMSGLDKNIHAAERFLLKKRIKQLSSHALVCLPVQQAVFATKIQNDKVRGGLTPMPEPLKDFMHDNSLDNFKEFDKTLNNLFSDASIEEQEQLLEMQRLYASYTSLTRLELVEKAPEILCHLMIPPMEEYNLQAAKDRMPYFLNLNAAKAVGLINFISAVLKTWKVNTAIFSIQNAPEQTPEQLLKSAESLQRSITGLRSLLSTYEATPD